MNLATATCKVVAFILFVVSPFISYGQGTLKKDEAPDSLVNACSPTNKRNYFGCLDSLYKRYPANITRLKVINKKSIFLLQAGQYDSALSTARSGLKYAEADRDTINQGVFLNTIAASYQMKGDLRNAIEYYVKTAAIFEDAGDSLKAGVIYTNIGLLNISLKDFERAEQYVSKAHEIISTYDNKDRESIVLSILASVQLNLKDTTAALQNARKALQISRGEKAAFQGRVTSSLILGDILYSRGAYDSAKRYYMETETLSANPGLSYYDAEAKAGLTKLYLSTGSVGKALYTAKKAIDIAETRGHESVLEKLYRLYGKALAATGRNKEAYAYLDKSYRINDSINSAENKQIVNNIRIKYETEKKDREIAENKLALQKQSVQLYKRNLYLVLLVLFAAVLIMVIVLIRMRNKHKMQKLAEQRKIQVLNAQVAGEEKERKRIARELHDGIANDMAIMKMKLDNLSDSVEQKQIGSEISMLSDLAVNAHKETRRISHNLYPVQLISKGLVKAVKDYLSGISIEGCKLEIQVIERGIVQLTKDRQLLLFRLIQELTGNTLKHSNAKHIMVDMLISEEVVQVTVEDDGTGMTQEQLSDPANLIAIKENTSILDGAYDIISNDSEGTAITISIPNKA